MQTKRRGPRVQDRERGAVRPAERPYEPCRHVAHRHARKP